MHGLHLAVFVNLFSAAAILIFVAGKAIRSLHRKRPAARDHSQEEKS